MRVKLRLGLIGAALLAATIVLTSGLSAIAAPPPPPANPGSKPPPITLTQNGKTRVLAQANATLPAANSPAEVQRAPGAPIVISQIGQLGGEVRPVAVAGSTLVMGIGTRLAVMNLTNPAAPTITGLSEPLPHMIHRITVVGNLAYLAINEGGIAIVDITVPSAPHVRGTLELEGFGAVDIQVRGAVAYAVAGGRIYYIDVSNPSAPTIVGSLYNRCTCPGSRLLFSGDRAYLAHAAGVDVLDATNPTGLVWKGYNDLGGNFGQGWGGNMVLANRWLWVVDTASSSIMVLNVNDPTRPYRVRTYQLRELIASMDADLDAEGNVSTLYVMTVPNGTTGGYYRVYDPTSGDLKELGKFDLPGMGYTFARLGNKVCFDQVLDGLLIVDATDPAAMTQLGQVAYMAPVGVATSGNHGFVSRSDRRFSVLDLTTPASPTIASTVDLGLSGGQVVLLDNAPATAPVGVNYPLKSYAYVVGGTDGIGIVDVTNPSAPTVLTPIKTTGEARDLVIDAAKYAYIADVTVGLVILNVADPANPTVVSTYAANGAALSVVVSGNRAYLGTDKSVEVIDITNRAAPARLGITETQSGQVTLRLQYQEMADVGAAGASATIKVLYSGFHYSNGSYDVNGVIPMNVTDPTNITGDRFWAVPEDVMDMSLFGRYLFIADGPKDVWVMDVNVAMEPDTIARVTAPGWVSQLAVTTDKLYVSAVHGGFQAFDWKSMSERRNFPVGFKVCVPDPEKGCQ